MRHDWDEGSCGVWCCQRCGATAEQNDAYDGFVYSRPECFAVPNVVPMTLRRAQQIRDAKGGTIVVEKFDGRRVTITTDDGGAA
jgi:ATP-dependent DNA ligase